MELNLSLFCSSSCSSESSLSRVQPCFALSSLPLPNNRKSAHLRISGNKNQSRFLYSRASKLMPDLPLHSTGQETRTSDSYPMSDSSACSVDPSCTEIVVVRHGETAWNADGRLQGHLDVELNEVGRQQAASVAQRLNQGPKISAIYSSDLKRALDTAEIIASSCGGLEVVKDADLRERHLGDLQGMVLRDAAKASPSAYKAFLSHRTDQDLPGGGESMEQLFNRCTSLLQRIAQKHTGERVVVVTHGGVIRSLYKRARPNDKSAGKILNTSINIFHLSNSDWKITTWGDVSHLKQTEYLDSAFGGDRTSG